MRGKGGVLRDVEAGTRSLIRYLALQLELKLDPGPATRWGSEKRPGGWDGGGLNYDGGGDGDGNANDMARYQNRVACKEDNTLLPGDEVIAAQLFPALSALK